MLQRILILVLLAFSFPFSEEQSISVSYSSTRKLELGFQRDQWGIWVHPIFGIDEDNNFEFKEKGIITGIQYTFLFADIGNLKLRGRVFGGLHWAKRKSYYKLGEYKEKLARAQSQTGFEGGLEPEILLFDKFGILLQAPVFRAFLLDDSNFPGKKNYKIDDSGLNISGFKLGIRFYKHFGKKDGEK